MRRYNPNSGTLLANIPLIEFLCEMTTIDLSVHDTDGRTAWHWAAINGNLEALKSMWQVVLSKRNKNWPEMLNIKDDKKFTPLDYASEHFCEKILSPLQRTQCYGMSYDDLKNDYNKECQKYTETMRWIEGNGGVKGAYLPYSVYGDWFKAIEKEDLNTMKKIYEEYSNIDVNRPDPETNGPPLITAVRLENINIPLIEFLCEIHTIDLSIQDNFGYSAWHWAATNGNLEALKSMRQAVASKGNKNWPEMLNTVDNSGWTPLDYASEHKIESPLCRACPRRVFDDYDYVQKANDDKNAYDRECQKYKETMQWLKDNGGLTHRDLGPRF
jgi:ankyrin repeat protein